MVTVVLERDDVVVETEDADDLVCHLRLVLFDDVSPQFAFLKSEFVSFMLSLLSCLLLLFFFLLQLSLCKSFTVFEELEKRGMFPIQLDRLVMTKLVILIF